MIGLDVAKDDLEVLLGIATATVTTEPLRLVSEILASSEPAQNI